MSSNRETEALWRFIKGSVDRIVACLDGLTEDDLNWCPLENANSLYVLATHTMSTAEQNILGVIRGESIPREREGEFKARGSRSATVRRQWTELQERIASNLARISTADLEREYEHPRRGRITGRETLIVVARHAAEHMRQAELTLDLLMAARGRPPVARDAYGTPIRE